VAVDETCIEVGKQKYLYRAVDSAGQTLGFGWLLSGILLLQTLFHKAFKAFHTQEPRVINVDKNTAYPKAIDELKAKKELSSDVELRQNKYLNNQLSRTTDLLSGLNRDGVQAILTLQGEQ